MEGFMVKKNRWVNNYCDLSPDDQLIVAEAIATELRDNESILDSKDGYNSEKSKIVRNFFELIRPRLESSQKLKKYEEIFEKYESLSAINKERMIDEFFEIVLKYFEIQEQENKEEICKKEGHIFGKWNHNKWIDYVDTVIDHQHIQNYPVEQENWGRACSRCGLVENIDYEPEEIIAERKEKNRIRKIKKL